MWSQVGSHHHQGLKYVMIIIITAIVRICTYPPPFPFRAPSANGCQPLSAMPPKGLPTQHVLGGFIRLQDGTPLPMSTYKSEMLRLMTQAADKGDFKLGKKWLNHRLKRDILTLYGRTCWRCQREILMHWKEQPICRELAYSDRAGSTNAYFHTDCWKIYRRLKTKKRRRESAAHELKRARHAGMNEVGHPQPAPAVAAGVGNPQPAPAVAPEVGNPQPPALPPCNPDPAPAVVQGWF